MIIIVSRTPGTVGKYIQLIEHRTKIKKSMRYGGIFESDKKNKI